MHPRTTLEHRSLKPELLLLLRPLALIAKLSVRLRQENSSKLIWCMWQQWQQWQQ
jgi:hypothetical protein